LLPVPVISRVSSAVDESMEEWARTVVTSLLGATSVRRDVPGAPDSTYDLDVSVPDGRTIALEVTQDADRRVREAYASLRAGEKHGWRVEGVTPQRFWTVDLRRGVQHKTAKTRLMTHGERLLRELETAGVFHFIGGSPTSQPPVYQAVRELMSLAWSRLPACRLMMVHRVRCTSSRLCGQGASGPSQSMIWWRRKRRVVTTESN
jgi:hypothetical protein